MAQVSDAQVSFTASLEEILYVKVKSGGNIDFVFNTIQDFKTGIVNSARYTTTLAVTSSSNYDIYLFAEDATLIGIEDAATHSMTLDNIGFSTSYTGALTPATEFDLLNAGALTALTSNDATKLVANKTSNYEQGAEYQIAWECGTKGGGGMNPLTILEQNKHSDRYIVNVTIMIDALP